MQTKHILQLFTVRHLEKTTSSFSQSQAFLQQQNPQSPTWGKLKIDIFKCKLKEKPKNGSNFKRVSRKCRTVKSCKMCLVFIRK